MNHLKNIILSFSLVAIQVICNNAVIELNQEIFESTIRNNKIVIVDFYATWCNPCKAIKPKFEELAQENPEWTCCCVNIDNNQEISDQYNITMLPTFIVFKDGQTIGTFTGGNAALKDRIESILSGETAASSTYAQKDNNFYLFNAILTNDIDKIKQLTNNLDLNQVIEMPIGNWFILEMAVLFGSNEEVIDFIVSLGAEVNSKIVELLDKKIKDYELAIDNFRKSFEYAKSKISNTTQVIDNSEKKNDEELQKLFISAIILAANGNTSLLEELIKKNADVNMAIFFQYGVIVTSPLKFAITLNCKDAIDLLVEAGANLNTTFNLNNGTVTNTEEAIILEIQSENEKLNKINERFNYVVSKYLKKN